MITDSNTDEILSNRKFLYQPVKVNSQSRNPQDRLLHPYKLMCIRDPAIPLLPYNHPTSYSKITVKPCVPQSTTISLYPNLKITSFGYLRNKKQDTVTVTN